MKKKGKVYSLSNLEKAAQFKLKELLMKVIPCLYPQAS